MAAPDGDVTTTSATTCQDGTLAGSRPSCSSTALAAWRPLVVALCRGCLHRCGEPCNVLTEDTVREVFGMECRVINDPLSGRPHMLPIGRHHTGV